MESRNQRSTERSIEDWCPIRVVGTAFLQLTSIIKDVYVYFILSELSSALLGECRDDGWLFKHA